MTDSKLRQATKGVDRAVKNGLSETEAYAVEEALAPFISECPLCEIHKESERVLDETLSKLKADSKVDPAELDIPIISNKPELDIEGLAKKIAIKLDREFDVLPNSFYKAIKSIVSEYFTDKEAEGAKDDLP